MKKPAADARQHFGLIPRVAQAAGVLYFPMTSFVKAAANP
jgi:hypothetical protein